MPKHRNRATAARNQSARVAQDVDPERSLLLSKILEESSSPALNASAFQQNVRQAFQSHTTLFNLLVELRQKELSLNPNLPCRNGDNWLMFFNWIKAELGDGTFLDRISVSERSRTCSDFPQNQRREHALVAKKVINEGDTVFAIPRKIMLTTKTALKDKEFLDFVNNDAIASSMQNVVLTLHLLNEHSKGEKSYWWPYISILPNKILPVLQLDEKKAKNLLASSYIFEILNMIRSISRQYAYFFKRLQSTNLPLLKNFTYEYYCWGVSIVCSRQNEMPYFDRCQMPMIRALIPILDMCNHDHLSNQATFEDNLSKLIATQSYNIGDEITINYGFRSSGEFYIHNGFVPEIVPLDVVPLAIVISQQDGLFKLREQLLESLDLPTYGNFNLIQKNNENVKKDLRLIKFLSVYCMNGEELNLVMSNTNHADIVNELTNYVQRILYQFKQEDQLYLKSHSDSSDKKREAVESIKKRLLASINDYLSKRATIGIAFIDKSLNDKSSLDEDACLMLKHERNIYESHLINNNS